MSFTSRQVDLPNALRIGILVAVVAGVSLSGPADAATRVISGRIGGKPSIKSTYGTVLPGFKEPNSLRDADLAAARARNPPARSGGVKD